MRDRTPRTQAELPTNPPELALHNLDSQIAGQQALVDRGQSPSVLITLLLQRGTFRGLLIDYERAEALALARVKAQPKAPVAWMDKARTASVFHRFDEAERDLNEAGRLGENPVELEAPRMALDEARGRNGDAVYAYRRKIAKGQPTLDKLLAFAIVEGERGDEAAQTFADAQDSYHDVSPFPVAALYFQEGLLEQRLGSQARARTLFSAAHDRMPSYAQATAHLAATLASTGNKDAAIALLRPLADNDDPEHAGQLAALTGDVAVRDEAAARFEVLLSKHPLAFADHAARFYLSWKPQRAFELAKWNEENRSTVDALRLFIDASLAVNDRKSACVAADQLLAKMHVASDGIVAAARAHAACGQKARAEAELGRLATQ